MQNNVIYGAFPTRTTDSPSLPASLTRVAETTPVSLAQRLNAQHKVLKELATLIHEPDLPVEIANPLKEQFRALETRGQELAKLLEKARNDDAAFLQSQTDMDAFSRDLIAFEAETMHRTGAQLELVNLPQPNPPVTQQLQGLTTRLVNSPKFWLSLSASVAVLGGLLYWGLNRKEKAQPDTLIKRVERVKLRRAVPAR